MMARVGLIFLWLAIAVTAVGVTWSQAGGLTVETPAGPLPDLVVGGIGRERFPEPCRQNPYWGHVSVRHIGQADAGPFAVDLEGERQRVAGLRADRYVSLWFMTSTDSGSTVTVDVLDEVIESNEENNSSVKQGTPTRTHTPKPDCWATPAATPALVRGDANCNTGLTSVDAALVLQYTAEIIGPTPCLWQADMNADCFTDAIDATLILQVSAALLPQPLFEFVACP